LKAKAAFAAWLKPLALELMTLLAQSSWQQSAMDLVEAARSAKDEFSAKPKQPDSVLEKWQRSRRELASHCERALRSAGPVSDWPWRRLPASTRLLSQRAGQISSAARSVVALLPPGFWSGRVPRPNDRKRMSSRFQRSLP
jgi:hypothetical protein